MLIKKQGRGFWQLINTMLKDLEFLHSTNIIIRDTVKEYLVQDFEEGDVDYDTLNHYK